MILWLNEKKQEVLILMWRVKNLDQPYMEGNVLLCSISLLFPFHIFFVKELPIDFVQVKG